MSKTNSKFLNWDLLQINPIYIGLGLGLVGASIINYQDFFYVSSPFFAYELPKYIYAWLRLILILFFMIFIINKSFKLNLEHLFRKSFGVLVDLVYWVGPIIVLCFYVVSIYFFKSNFILTQKDFGVLGVVTSIAPFSDFGVLNWQVSCYQDGISPYVNSQCNNFHPLNYSMIWVYFLNYIGGGKGFEESNLYLGFVLLMLIFFCSVSYFFIKNKKLSLFYLLAISSPPIQTLFFQQNNDLHLAFTLFLSSIFISYRFKSKLLDYSQIFLLTFLAILKIYFLPVLVFYSMLLFFSKRKDKESNINIWILLALIMLSIGITLIDIREIYRNSHVPSFYTYGINSVRVLLDYFNDSIRWQKQQVNRALLNANLFFLITAFICIAFSLKKIIPSILNYSNSSTKDLSQTSNCRMLEVVCGSIYLLTSTVMPSYDLRLWSLVGAIVCSLSNIYHISKTSGSLPSVLPPNLSTLIICFSLIAFWVTPFSIYFYSLDIVIFFVFIIFYSVHLSNLLIKCLPRSIYKFQS